MRAPHLICRIVKSVCRTPTSAVARALTAAVFMFVLLFGLGVSVERAEAASCPTISSHGDLLDATAPADSCDTTWVTNSGELSLVIQVLDTGSQPCPAVPCVRVIGAVDDDNNWTTTFVPQTVTVPTGGTCTSVDFLTTNSAGNLASIGVTIADGDTCTLTAIVVGNGLTVSMTGTLTRSGSGISFAGATTSVTVVSGDLAKAFMINRLRNLVADDPSGSRAADRLNGGGGGAPGAAMSFAPDLSSGRFSTSLNRIAAAFGTVRPESPVGTLGYAEHRAPGPTRATDVWIEGRYARFADDTASSGRAGDFAVVHAGIDHLAGNNLLLGGMVTVDYTGEQSSTGDISGIGWMAGPYAALRLSPNVILNVRGAWGQSYNNVTVAGDAGSFDADRWLVRGDVTGSFEHGAWRISPMVGVAYVEEAQKAYTTSGGLNVAAQRVFLGRLTFGPRISYQMTGSHGGLVEPHLAVTGAWDFSHAGAVFLDGVTATASDIHARVAAGITMTGVGGNSLRVEGHYDGLGAEAFSSYGGKVGLSAPLN